MEGVIDFDLLSVEIIDDVESLKIWYEFFLNDFVAFKFWGARSNFCSELKQSRNLKNGRNSY